MITTVAAESFIHKPELGTHQSQTKILPYKCGCSVCKLMLTKSDYFNLCISLMATQTCFLQQMLRYAHLQLRIEVELSAFKKRKCNIIFSRITLHLILCIETGLSHCQNDEMLI